MLKTIFKPYGGRGFSSSKMWNAAKEKDIVKPPEVPQSAGFKIDFEPSEFEKIILVLSGKYKSKDSIPSRISYDTMENAKSRFRIRGSNILIVCTLILCGYYAWKGKKRAREGQSITAMYFEKKRRAESQKVITPES